MNAKSVISLVILIPLTLACNVLTFSATPTSVPTATAVPRTIHFGNELVAFDYPEGLRVFNPGDPAFITYPQDIKLGGELVIGLADSHWIKVNTLYSSIGIFRHPIPPGSSLEKIMQTAYKQKSLQTEIVESSTPVTFAGMPAIQRNYRIASGPLWYKLQDTWVEKNGQILRISIWEEVYAFNFKYPADMFLNSLVIK